MGFPQTRDNIKGSRVFCGKYTRLDSAGHLTYDYRRQSTCGVRTPVEISNFFKSFK